MHVSGGIPQDMLPLIEEWPKWHQKNIKQKQFIASIMDTWETIFLGGNGSGKSHICYWADTAFTVGVFPNQKKMKMNPPIRIKCLIRDFEHGLDKVAKETLFDPVYMPDGTEIGPLFPRSMVEKDWSKEDKTLRLKNGSRIEWMTSQQKRFQHSGTNYDILHPDEEPEESAYDESIRGLRNAKGGGKVFWGFTPPFEEGKGPSWSKEKKFDIWEASQDKDLNLIRASIHDNPAITEEYIKRFSRGKTESQLRVQLHGDYPVWGRLVFPAFDPTPWNPDTLAGNILSQDWEPAWGANEGSFEFSIDWHPSKAPAALWTYEYRNGDVVVFDEMAPEVGRDKTILEICELIHEVEGHPHHKPRIYRYGDPKMKDKSNALISGFNAWDAFRHGDVFLKEGYNRQPEVGISVINDFLAGNRTNHPRLFVRENCVNLIKQLRNHYWTDQGKPDAKNSDYPICLRYVMQRKGRKSAKFGRAKKSYGLTSYDGWKGFKYKPAVGMK